MMMIEWCGDVTKQMQMMIEWCGDVTRLDERAREERSTELESEKCENR